jgi:Uma2 family endonuclease
MSAMHVVQRMTADEYLTLGEGHPRTQLIEGEVVLYEPELLHQMVLMDLMGGLREWTKAAPGRGLLSLPLDVKLDERNVFAPDLLWYAEQGAPARRDKRPYPLPRLAIEVRSPSTWRYDIGAKRAAYEREGLAELWLVDTKDSRVLVLRRSQPSNPAFDVALELGQGDELGSPQLPGFALDVASLFAG